MAAMEQGHGSNESEREPLAPGDSTAHASPAYNDTYETITLSPSTLAMRKGADTYESMARDLPEVALFTLTKENKLRRFTIYIVKNEWFTRVVLLVILLNCVSLAASSNSPAFDKTAMGKMLDKIEYFFIAFFTLEMALKILAMGFILERGTYMRDPWNIMDFVVVVLGLASLYPQAGNYTAIRAVRVLRPLRTITKVKGMRNLVITLLESLPMLLDVLVLCFFAFFIYGIIGIQLMAGTLRYRCAPSDGFLTSQDLYDATERGELTEFCSGTKIDERLYQETAFDTDMLTPVVVNTTDGIGHTCTPGDMETYCRLVNYNPNHGITNFDHFPAALLTIFQCISLEGWTDVMYYLQDAVSSWIWIYFVSLIWFGSFFAVNLALAVLYLRFKQSQEVSAEEAVQERQEAIAKGELPEDPDDTANLVPVVNGPAWWRRFRTWCFHLQAHRYFEALTMGIIIINTAIMMVERYPQPSHEREVMDYINYALTAYFAIEMVLKIVGLGIRGYVADTMNVFDGLVVIVSIVEIALSSQGGGGSGLSVLRTFRLLRIFKLARSWKELNKIINTIFQSLASIAYLSLILLLMMFIFALLGMQLFGYRYYYCDPYPNSYKLCPEDTSEPGVEVFMKCPSHFRCYMTCDSSLENQWFHVHELADEATSQFFDQAFCEKKTFVWDSVHSPEMRSPPDSSLDNTTHFVALVGESDLARHHFDDIYMSFITIFQILTGENWNTVMYDGMRSTGTIACIYFVLLVVVGNYVILNLFLAILLDNFSTSDDEGAGDSFGDQPPSELAASAHRPGTPEMEEGTEDDPTNIIRSGNTNRSLRLRSSMTPHTAPTGRTTELTHRSLFIFGPENPLRVYLNTIVSHKYFEYCIIGLIILSSACLALDSNDVAEMVAKPEGTPGREDWVRLKNALTLLDTIFVILFCVEALLKVVVMGFVLHPGSYLRNPWNVLDFFIVIIGLVLQLSGAMGSSSQAESVESLRALRTFRALRPIRMASRAEGMKVVVNALFQSIPPLGNVVLVCMLFFLIFSILFVNLLKGSFYACRVVCPEADVGSEFCSGSSWLANNAGLRLDSIYFLGGPDVGQKIDRTWCEANSDVTLSGVGYHVVGVYPNQTEMLDENGNPYLVSSDYHWTALNQTYSPDSFHNSSFAAPLPLADGLPVLYHEWVNKDVNFDNVLNSLITLFEMATMEMWLDVMYDAADATGIDEQPVRDSKLWICLIVVMFLVVCSFFVLNLFVGVTIDKFNDMKAKQEGRSLFLTEEQQNWLTIQKLLAGTKPVRKFKPPDGGIRRLLYIIVSTDAFDAFIMAMIMINVLFMSMEHYDMSEGWVMATTYANYVFTALFTMEALLKLLSMGVVGYFRDPWNSFDFTVVTVSIVGIILENSSSVNVSAVSLLRVFRVARIFRLIPKAKGLRTLFQTLVFSLPALFNVGSVLLLFFFIFSIMGMNLFGSIRESEFLNRHANFQNFASSMLVLMRMATGESWNGIMHDCTVMVGCIKVLHPVQLYNFAYPVEAGSYIDPDQASYNCESCYEPNPDIPDWPGTNEFVPPPHYPERPEYDIDDYNSDYKLPVEVGAYYFKNECGQHMAVASAYFIAFVLICSFILLNLVIAVILDNFQSSSANEAMPVSRFHMSRFVEAWANLDPLGTCFIPVSKLSHLISELEPPLGVKGVVHTKSEVQNIIMTVDIPNRAGQVHFLETLHALSGRVAGTQLPEDEELLIHKQMHERLPDTTYPKYSAAHYHAALYVQAAVRGFLARHQMKNRLHSTSMKQDPR